MELLSELLKRPEVYASAVGLLAGFLIEIIFDKSARREHKERLIIMPLVFGLIGFTVERFLTIEAKVSSISDSLLQVRLTETLNRTSHTVLGPFFEQQKELITERLKQMEHLDIRLRRAEFFPAWANMIKSSKREILATNIIDQSDWNGGATKGEETQCNALRRGVAIKRIFIHRGSQPDPTTTRLARRQQIMGVLVRFLSDKLAHDRANFESAIDTLDMVVYDREAILLATVDKRYMVSSGRLSGNAGLTAKAQQLYEALWKIAQPMEVFSEAMQIQPQGVAPCVSPGMQTMRGLDEW